MFRKIVKQEIRTYAFKSLMQRKKSYKKLSKVDYNELKLQSYLNDCNTTKEEKIELFKWRTFMSENIAANFRGGKSLITCTKCGNHVENEEELFSNCTYIKENMCVEESFLEAFKDEV